MLLLSTAALVLLNAQSVLSSCAYGTYLHRRAAEGEVEVSKFGYGPENGPTNWHALSPENQLCGVGTMQSPINIDETILQKPAGFLSMNLPVQDVKFENLGSTVEVVLKGTTTIGGREFALQQFHFHTPSEHTINGEQFPAEIHMVHAAVDNPEEVAVVGLIVQATARDSVHSIDSVINCISNIATPGTIVDIPQLDLADIANTVNKLGAYSYTGSLTTPPCTEGVPFFILSEAIPMNVNVFNALKAVVGHNARFLQSSIPAESNVLVAGAQALPTELRCDAAVAPGKVRRGAHVYY
ncbi:hypothetical protein AJ79_06805 [Helicocarpus griseus UAMH5409]|uniref:Carbonic anhydrase n=1 Tax=Helicocarpus griseus UAMH5409 TaxID=1447875 RepID=A0A2B7XA22_9EURO|nr:hypothetical protein AJ79_06805 [Helicocarpus griseus UAMH5409]